MFGGIDPKQMEQVQKISKNVKGKIIINYRNKSIAIGLKPSTKEAAQFVDGLLPEFGKLMAQQLNTVFAISGEIEEIK